MQRILFFWKLEKNTKEKLLKLNIFYLVETNNAFNMNTVFM